MVQTVGVLQTVLRHQECPALWVGGGDTVSPGWVGGAEEMISIANMSALFTWMGSPAGHLIWALYYFF